MSTDNHEELVERVARALEGFTLGNPIHAARAAIEATGLEQLHKEVERLDPDSIATAVCLDVCELPDRTSPDDWPEACLVTSEELHVIVSERIRAALTGEQS